MNNKYLLSGLTGVLLALSFPPLPFFFLAFIGFVPLLFAIENGESPKKSFLMVYIAFWIYHGGTNWWISSWQEQTDPFLMMSGIVLTFFHPFLFMLPFALYFYLRRKIGSDLALWAFPFIWTAFEWAHSLGEFSYPWLTVGNTQILNVFWIQFIDITGVWGSSLLIGFINVIVLKVILIYREKKLTGVSALLHNKNAKRMFVAGILIFLVPYVYGIVAHYNYDHGKLLKKNPHLNVGVVQPSINPWEKWQSGVYDQIKMHQNLQDSLTEAVSKLDLAIWSETALPPVSLDFNSRFEFPILWEHVLHKETSLISGFAETHLYKSKEEAGITATPLPRDSSTYYQSFNAAIALNPTSDSVQIYRKMKLTPFAERIPHVEALYFMRQWLEWGVGISNWGRGKNQHNLNIRRGLDSYDVGVIICIESIYPNFCRKFTNQGAGMLSVITNDAWYDYTVGPMQHYLIAAVRAVENKRYIARCANTGVSGFISPLGRTLDKLPQYERSALALTVPYLQNKTLYVKFGDWLGWLCLIVSLGFVGISFIGRK